MVLVTAVAVPDPVVGTALDLELVAGTGAAVVAVEATLEHYYFLAVGVASETPWPKNLFLWAFLGPPMLL